jgi:putative transposase
LAFEEECKPKVKKLEKERRLSKRVKFTLNSLSHYRFREHLLEKGKEYGSQIIIVGEEYTSKTCTNCGFKSNEYDYREKQCANCKCKLDRDVTGSRNILLKNLNKVGKIK